MRKIIFCILLGLVFFMLMVNKDVDISQKKNNLSKEKENPLIVKLLKTAHSYENTPYKFGGTTVAGMDCSGLVFTSYKSLNINLARSSRNMFLEGIEVPLGEVKLGDLLFFDTENFKDKVNHVALVTSIDEDVIYFMHSTNKKGVIISSLKESYWDKAFIKAKRILI